MSYNLLYTTSQYIERSRKLFQLCCITIVCKVIRMGTSTTDEGSVERADESDLDRVLTRQQVGGALSKDGFEDVLVLSHESADRVLTPTRREIIRALREQDYESQNQLAEALGRDPGNVKRDLDVLIEEDIVQRVRDGKAKKPALKHETIITEPIVATRSNPE
jgi:predicted transcriptional regulator